MVFILPFPLYQNKNTQLELLQSFDLPNGTSAETVSMLCNFFTEGMESQFQKYDQVLFFSSLNALPGGITRNSFTMKKI